MGLRVLQSCPKRKEADTSRITQVMFLCFDVAPLCLFIFLSFFSLAPLFLHLSLLSSTMRDEKRKNGDESDPLNFSLSEFPEIERSFLEARVGEFDRVACGDLSIGSVSTFLLSHMCCLQLMLTPSYPFLG